MKLYKTMLLNDKRNITNYEASSSNCLHLYPSLKGLRSLSTQSSSSRNELMSLSTRNTFSEILRMKQGDKEKFLIFKIERPHANDVLCGRGNHVVCHPGNEYYRFLIKRHMPEYLVTPKQEKPRLAVLIHREIRMRDPPGRFLKQDSKSGMWADIGDQKALDKTRQTLNEGSNKDEFEANNNNSDHENKASHSGRPSLSSQLSLDSIASKVTTTEIDVQMRDDSMLNEIVHKAAKINNKIIQKNTPVYFANPNVVGGDTVTLSEPREVLGASTTIGSKTMEGSANESSGIYASTNTVNDCSVASPEETKLKGILPKIALYTDSIDNTTNSGRSVLIKKRLGNYETMKADSKRIKSCVPYETSSSTAKNSVVASAFHYMSSTDVDERMKDKNLGGKMLETKNQTEELSSSVSTTQQSCVNELWKHSNFNPSSSSFENLMPCDTCLGTGTLPIPSFTLRPHNTRDVTPAPNQDSIAANFKLLLSESQSSDILNTNQSQNTHTRNNTNIDNCKTEKKWYIPNNDGISYPSRIKEIENKSTRYMKILHNSNSHPPPSTGKVKKELFSLVEAERAQDKLEKAECKWGLTPSEGQTCAERVDLVERAASMHKLAEEERKWGITPFKGQTCEERAEIVNQSAVAYMKRLDSLL